MTPSDFRTEVEKALEEFLRGWAALQSQDPDFFPSTLPFQEWWSDFTEAVEAESVRAPWGSGK